MATNNRKARKQEVRRQREEQRLRAARLRAYRMAAGGVVVAVVAIVALVVAIDHRTTNASARSTPPAHSKAGVLPGDSTGSYPWPIESSHLLVRLGRLGLPKQDGTAFHIHEHLVIVVEGHEVQVPQNIGLWPDLSHFAPLHTHDTSGIIHVESPVQRTYTLGDFFAVWGVRFTSTCIGGYCDGGGMQLRVYVDGRLFAGDPTTITLVDHQEIVVTFGTTRQLPKPIPSNYSGSLSPTCAPTC